MSEELKPCPFCGRELLNATSGDFPEGDADGKMIAYHSPWHNSPGCFLHGLEVSETELALNFAKRWNTRADLLPVVKPLVWEGEHELLGACCPAMGFFYVEEGSGGGWFGFRNDDLIEYAGSELMGEDTTHADEIGFSTPTEAQAKVSEWREARIRASLDMTDPAALVAGAYEAAASKLAKAAQAEAEINNPHDAELLWHMEKRIRALTPADAQAALDAAIAKAVNEKLDEVVSNKTITDGCEGWCKDSGSPGVYEDCLACIQTKAILAMKEPE